MYTVESFTHRGYSVRIEPDDTPESPREWDNLGTMVCFHERHNLGDRHDYRTSDFDERTIAQVLKDDGEEPAVILPLYLYDHSGVSIRTDPAGFRASDSMGWDWGCVGFVYVSKAKVRAEYSVRRISKRTLAKATEVLVAEVETYDDFISGRVYGYIVGDASDDYLDSCWGYYGLDYCIEEAKAVADYLADQRDAERLECETEVEPVMVA
jgi:hypothetical protein